MRVSVFDRFGALNSAPVFEAIRAGITNLGWQCASHDMTSDVAVIWSVVWAGRMQPNYEIWRYFRQKNRAVVVAEVGMLRRNHTWKLGLNGTGLAAARSDAIEPDRAKKLGISLEAWRQHGSDIVIALQRQDSEQWSQAPKAWLDQTIARIRSYTQRDIVVRPHPRYGAQLTSHYRIQTPRRLINTYDDYDIRSGIDRAWAVVNWNSGIGPLAAIHGIPVFVGPDSLAAPVGNHDLSHIESPHKPDRAAWLDMLCHTEWTLDEIATGQPLARLLGQR